VRIALRFMTSLHKQNLAMGRRSIRDWSVGSSAPVS
jgi:hypothetical protein